MHKIYKNIKQNIINLLKEIRNTSIFNQKKNFYIYKYSAIVVILLAFELFSSVFSFKKIFCFLFLIAFIFIVDLITIFLKSDLHENNKKEIDYYEKAFLLVEGAAIMLVSKDVVATLIKSIIGLLITIAITYFTLEMIRQHSDNPEIKGRKYIKYFSLILLPLIFISPFPMIFVILYYVFYFLMVPGIILGLIYLMIEIGKKVKLSFLISCFTLLFLLLMFCL
jgi:hypothetical protein